MSYNYILHAHAQQDYEQSLKWYMERSIVAAERFVVAINNALQLICDNPTRWRKKYKNFHEISLKKYPFTIIYTNYLYNRRGQSHSRSVFNLSS